MAVVKRYRKRRKEKKKKKTGREKKREKGKKRKRRKTVAGILTFINNTSEIKGNNMQFIERFCYNIRELFCF